MIERCAVCSSTRSRLLKGQEAKGILSSLSLKTSLSKIQLLRYILF